MPNHILPQTPRRRRFPGVAAADAAVAYLPDACLQQMADHFAGKHRPYPQPGTSMVDAEMLEHGAALATGAMRRAASPLVRAVTARAKQQIGITEAPWRFAMALAASPAEVVPPRISRRSPLSRASALSRHAVC